MIYYGQVEARVAQLELGTSEKTTPSNKPRFAPACCAILQTAWMHMHAGWDMPSGENRIVNIHNKT